MTPREALIEITDAYVPGWADVIMAELASRGLAIVPLELTLPMKHAAWGHGVVKSYEGIDVVPGQETALWAALLEAAPK